MELLNLDDLVKVGREVVLSGETYKVVDQTVGDMVDALRLAKKVEKNQDDPEVILGSLLSTAQRLIPACPKDVLNKMVARQLSALIEFASASDEEVIESAEVEVVDGDEGK